MAATSHPGNSGATAPVETDALIRSVMVDQRRVESRNALPELEPVEDVRPEPMVAPEAPQPAAPQKRGRLQALRSLRLKKAHLVWAVLAVIVILRPWLIPLVLFVGFWVALIIYLTLGPDRLAEMMASGWERLSRRRPDLADRLRSRADRFALTFDALLDRLPERWADKLALPDLSQAAQPRENLDDRPDPFEKLKPLPEVYRG